MKRLLCFLLLLSACGVEHAAAENREAPFGISRAFQFELRQIGSASADHELKVDAAHASGDTTIICDGAAQANSTNGFTDEGSSYAITLTAAEMTCKEISLHIVDQGTKAWVDKYINISTGLTEPTGTLVSGCTAPCDTGVLAAAASTVDDFYNNTAIAIVLGAGLGQAKCIEAYVGSTKTFTTSETFKVTTDNTSRYVLLPDICDDTSGGSAPTVDQIWAKVCSSTPTANTVLEVICKGIRRN